MSLRWFVTMIVGVLLLISCHQETASPDREVTQQETEEIMPDPWAGRTVADLGHAFEMVHARLRNAPKAGESAPDTILIDTESGKARSLRDLLRARPLVLIFGSGSCSVTNANLASLRDLAHRFENKADFYFVYLREAHPKGGYRPEVSEAYREADNTLIHDGRSMEERRRQAGQFARDASLGMPVLVDRMNDQAAVDWAAWPARLFVVEVDGTVSYAGGQGPWFYNPANEVVHSPPGEGLEEIANLPYDRGSLFVFLRERFARD